MEERRLILQKKQKNMRLVYAAMTVYLILAVFLMTRTMAGGLAAVAFAPILYVLTVKKAEKRLLSEVWAYHLESCYGQDVRSVRMVERNALNPQEIGQIILKAGMAPAKEEGILVLKGMTGQWKQLPLTLTEFSCRRETKNGFASYTGTAAKVVLPANFGRTFGVCCGKLEGGDGCREHGPEAGKRFRQAILKLQNASRDDVAAVLDGNVLYVLLMNAFFYPDYKIWSDMSQENLSRSAFPEFIPLLSFVNTVMNLIRE